MRIKIVLFSLILIFVASCSKKAEQTIETAYIDPLTLPRVLKYKFSRNGISNVDYLECRLIKEPLSIVYQRLKVARIFNQSNYDEIFKYYQTGIYQIKPENEVVSSAFHEEDRDKVRQDIIALINKTAEISGYGKSNPGEYRKRKAVPNQTGYIGYNIGDPNVAFVDEYGIINSEVFDGMIMGAIYLDKILNKHLDKDLFVDEKLLKDHEDIVLPEGRNYTELEHHWDLAYGYFGFLRYLTIPEGIPALKGCEQKVLDAFILGRTYLNNYMYEEMYEQMDIICAELSRAIAIRIINYLTGVNTIANLNEADGSDAFTFLSKAYGLIYAIQFARKPDGSVYFTYQQIQNILNQMKSDNGLWNTDKLLADEDTEGSVENIAKQIAEPFGFAPEDVRR